jgi:hypothetical protein
VHATVQYGVDLHYAHDLLPASQRYNSKKVGPRQLRLLGSRQGVDLNSTGLNCVVCFKIMHAFNGSLVHCLLYYYVYSIITFLQRHSSNLL